MTSTLRKQLRYYQQLMISAKTADDHTAHEVYRQKTRQLTEEIRQNEKNSLLATDCSNSIYTS